MLEVGLEAAQPIMVAMPAANPSGAAAMGLAALLLTTLGIGAGTAALWRRGLPHGVAARIAAARTAPERLHLYQALADAFAADNHDADAGEIVQRLVTCGALRSVRIERTGDAPERGHPTDLGRRSDGERMATFAFPAMRVSFGLPAGSSLVDGADGILLHLLARVLHATDERARQEAALTALAAEVEALRADAVAPEPEVEIRRPRIEVAEIIGSSPPLLALLDLVGQAAPTDVSVLITGETGTGKELIARALHRLSRRSAGPLVAVNCPAIPGDLAESELFGHERGAFTGAHEARAGKFEAAHGGTLFFDEVADLPMHIQTKLLRVLQEREGQRVGSQRVYKLDIRVVAATNRNLQEEARLGRFRLDLYYRLAGIELNVPALHERSGDVPMLAQHFVARAAASYGREVPAISKSAMVVLERHRWPGNVRELQHVVERAVLLCPGSVIAPEHLGGLAAPAPAAGCARATAGSLRGILHDAKIREVEVALVEAKGNQAAAARKLGMSRSNLSRLLKRHGIDVSAVMARAPAASGVAPAAPNRYHLRSIDG